MPEQPIPEQDPVVTKSYALYYVVSMALLMARCSGLYGMKLRAAAMEGFPERVEDALSCASGEETPTSDILTESGRA